MSFDKEFDADLGQKLINVYKEQVGCFNCRKPNPTKRCGQCQIVWYCDRECQVTDWKKQHKQLCQVWLDNRSGSPPGPIPICMFACGFIGETSMVQAMKIRRDLFLKEFKRMAAETEHDKEPQYLSLTLAVVEMFGKIRLVASAHLVDDNFEKIAVSHVLLEELEASDRETVNRLYEGSGTISEETRSKVSEKLISFVSDIKESNGLIVSITYGRGLMFLSTEEEFKQPIQTCQGSSEIQWIPDMNHAIAS